MKTCAYLRVSSDSQKHDIQLDAIKKYCEYNNLQYDIFLEKESGAKRDRPILNEMMSAIKEGKYKRLIVFKLDRIARSMLHFSDIVDELRQHECAFVSVTENIDFSTDVGQLVANVLASIAEFERKIMIGRITAGMRSAKSRGKILGVKPKPIDMALIRSQLAQGRSATDIAREQGLSRSQLYRRLAG
jgi:DNA invertase Pin-like site-specific DNA recombinase